MSPGSVPALGRWWTEYKLARRQFYTYRYEADILRKTGLALGFAALTGIAAQVRIPLPFTPVPITLQTFAVLLSGVALGGRWGGASQVAYAGLGAAGVPWFAGMAAGVGTLLGASGGYIVGFVLAASFVGYLTDRYLSARRLPALVAVLFVANFGLIYGVGSPWLYAWLTVVQGTTPTVMELLTMGLLPFIPGDIVKLLGAAAMANAITPLTAFGPEQTQQGPAD